MRSVPRTSCQCCKVLAVKSARACLQRGSDDKAVEDSYSVVRLANRARREYREYLQENLAVDLSSQVITNCAE